MMNLLIERLRSLKQFFIYTMILGMLLIISTSSLGLAFYAGRMTGRLDIKRNLETPMCTTQPTAIRENPTGFIIHDIRKRSIVWVVQLDVPFATVWYYTGSEWLLGSVKASALSPCEINPNLTLLDINS
jgi:hypothetical protein